VQRPRVESIPDYVSSAGEEAVEFCDSIGLHLDPWQRHVITHALGERRDGRYAAFEVGLIVPRQNGKGAVLEARELAGLFLLDEQLILHSAHEFKDLDVDTPILTARGWSTMGELVDGDQVYAPDGQLTEVVAAHPVLRTSDCYRVTFADGQSVVAGAGHLWVLTEVARDGSSERRVVTTDEIRRAGLVHEWIRPNSRNRHVYRWRVDLPAPLQGSPAELPIDPYLLGVWLGDGTKAKGEITCGAEDLDFLLGQLEALGERYVTRVDPRNGRVWTVRVEGLRDRLAAIGVLGNKHIPARYLTAPIPQRRALLAGIMDTDGTVSGHQIAVTMINESLMTDVAALVRSMGYRATLRTFRARLNGADAGPMYRVQFAPNGTSPFRLDRKTARIKQLKTSRSAYNAVVAVEPVPTRPTRCITVAHPSACYLVGRGFVPTHNTAQEGFRRTLAHVQNNRELEKRVARVRTSHGEEGIELKSGARLRFVARSTGSGRGFSGDCVILDEAYNLASEGMSALLPTLSARPNPQIWYTSSAGMTTSDQLRKVRERGIAGESKRLAYFEWSAPSEVDLDDRNAWAQANPALGIRITEEFIESERDAMDDLGFSRERLGLWFDPAAQMVIDGKKWRELADPSSKISGPVVFAVDATPERSGAAIAVAGRREDGLGHVEVIDARSGTGWVVRRLVDLVARHRPRAVILERASAAGSWIPALQEAGIDPVLAGARDMAQACGALYEDVTENAALRHLDQHPLNAALIGARKRTLADSWAWHRRDSSVDISPLVAVTLAWHGLAQHGAPARRSAYEDDDLVVV